MFAADLGLDGVICFLIAASPNSKTFLRHWPGVAVLVELVGVIIRVEDGRRVWLWWGRSLPGFRGSNPPVPSMDGLTLAQMGRPRAVEKGFRAWAVALEVRTGLYILGLVERINHRLANFGVGVTDIVSGKDILAVRCDLDAILGREGPGTTPIHTITGGKRLAGVPPWSPDSQPR
jgi:hypothetical protein